jgi:hypothetical protein
VHNAKIEHIRESEMSEIEEKVSAKDIPESSTQGETRGVTKNSGPYCYHCLTRGHSKEDCSVTLFRDICESVSHVKGRYPLLKILKP